MKYREVEFPNDKIVFLETSPSLNKTITIRWMEGHIERDSGMPPMPASEVQFGFGSVTVPFAMVDPPNFVERWFGVTHESKIQKQIDRGYRQIEKDLQDTKYRLSVKA